MGFHSKNRWITKTDLSPVPLDKFAIQSVRPSQIYEWPGVLPNVELTGTTEERMPACGLGCWCSRCRFRVVYSCSLLWDYSRTCAAPWSAARQRFYHRSDSSYSVRLSFQLQRCGMPHRNVAASCGHLMLGSARTVVCAVSTTVQKFGE
jgi:hypothetical protein